MTGRVIDETIPRCPARALRDRPQPGNETHSVIPRNKVTKNLYNGKNRFSTTLRLSFSSLLGRDCKLSLHSLRSSIRYAQNDGSLQKNPAFQAGEPKPRRAEARNTRPAGFGPPR